MADPLGLSNNGVRRAIAEFTLKMISTVRLIADSVGIFVALIER